MPCLEIQCSLLSLIKINTSLFIIFFYCNQNYVSGLERGNLMSPRLGVVSLNALEQSETNELELYCL